MKKKKSEEIPLKVKTEGELASDLWCASFIDQKGCSTSQHGIVLSSLL